MSSGRKLNDTNNSEYEFTPPMVSPISDSPTNPDAICMHKPRKGTVRTVSPRGGNGKAY